MGHERVVGLECRRTARRGGIRVVGAEVVIVPRVDNRRRSVERALGARREHGIVGPHEPRGIVGGDVLVVEVAHVNEQVGFEPPHLLEDGARRSCPRTGPVDHAKRHRSFSERLERATQPVFRRRDDVLVRGGWLERRDRKGGDSVCVGVDGPLVRDRPPAAGRDSDAQGQAGPAGPGFDDGAR